MSINVLLCLFALQLAGCAAVSDELNQANGKEEIKIHSAKNDDWVAKGLQEIPIYDFETKPNKPAHLWLPADSRLIQFYNSQPSTMMPIRTNRPQFQPNLPVFQGLYLPLSQQIHGVGQGNNRILQRLDQFSPESVQEYFRQSRYLQRLNQFSPESVQKYLQQSAILQRLNQLSPESIQAYVRENGGTASDPPLTRSLQHTTTKGGAELLALAQEHPPARPDAQFEEEEDQFFDALDDIQQQFPQSQQTSQFQDEDQYYDAVDTIEEEHEEPIAQLQLAPYSLQTYGEPEQQTDYGKAPIGAYAQPQQQVYYADPSGQPAFGVPQPQQSLPYVAQQQPAYEEPPQKPVYPPQLVFEVPQPNPVHVQPLPPPVYVQPPPPPAYVESQSPPADVIPPLKWPPSNTEPPKPSDPGPPPSWPFMLKPRTSKVPSPNIERRPAASVTVDQGSGPLKPPASSDSWNWENWHSRPAAPIYDLWANYDYGTSNHRYNNKPVNDQGMGLPYSPPPEYEQPPSRVEYVSYSVKPQSPVPGLSFDLYNNLVREFLATRKPQVVFGLGPPVYSDSDYAAGHQHAKRFADRAMAAGII